MATDFLQPKNFATTYLNGAIDAVQTSIIVADASVFPAATPYNLRIAELDVDGFVQAATAEFVRVTNVAGNTLTVVRGKEGIVAKVHASLEPCYLVISAEYVSEIHDAIIDLENGITGGQVTSVFGRDGVVIAAVDDYSADLVTNAFDKTADDSDDVDEGIVNLFFPEAPIDGEQYSRKDGAWDQVDAVPEAPSDTKTYGRRDTIWAELGPQTPLPSSGDQGQIVKVNDTFDGIDYSDKAVLLNDFFADGQTMEGAVITSGVGVSMLGGDGAIANGNRANIGVVGADTDLPEADMDYSEFSEVDEGGFATVTPINVTLANFTNTTGGSNNNLYVFKVLPSAVSEFMHRCNFSWTGGDAPGAAPWSVHCSGNVGGMKYLTQLGGPSSGYSMVHCEAKYNAGTNRLFLQQYIVGSASVDAWLSATLSAGTTYYLETSRAGNTVAAALYSDADYTTLIGSIFISLSVTNAQYLVQGACDVYAGSTGTTTSAVFAGLNIGTSDIDAIPGDCLIHAENGRVMTGGDRFTVSGDGLEDAKAIALAKGIGHVGALGLTDSAGNVKYLYLDDDGYLRLKDETANPFDNLPDGTLGDGDEVIAKAIWAAIANNGNNDTAITVYQNKYIKINSGAWNVEEDSGDTGILDPDKANGEMTAVEAVTLAVSGSVSFSGGISNTFHFGLGVDYLESTVTGVTGVDGATDTVVTINDDHGRVAGDYFTGFIADVVGATGVNGEWLLEVIDSTSFYLISRVDGNSITREQVNTGAYTSGGVFSVAPANLGVAKRKMGTGGDVGNMAASGIGPFDAGQKFCVIARVTNTASATFTLQAGGVTAHRVD